MKTFKRTLSCFLALLMIFGSCSVLSYAAFGDGSEKSITIETKFFVDGEEVTKVKAGDTVKARVYIATDFKIATTTLFWVYPLDFFKLDTSVLTSTGGDSYDVAGALNSSETSIAATANLGGFMVHQEGFVLDSMSDADNLVYEGYLTEDYFDDKGWISFSIDSGTPVVLTADNGNEDKDDDHLVEFTFTVKEDATGEGYFYIPEESVMNTTGQDYGFTAVQRAKSDTQFMVVYNDFAYVRAYDLALNDKNTVTLGSGEVTPTTYDVTYSFANTAPEGAGAVPADGTVEANGTIAAPVVTVPAGYTLTWAVTGATKQADGSYLAGEGDVAFVGTWAKTEYNVTYSFANAAPEGAGAVPADGKTTVGATIAAPVVTVPAGYTLTWEATGATKNDDGSYTAAANDVAFVGTWAKQSYTITYYLTEADKEAGKVYDTQTVEYGEALPAVTPDVEGKTFNNWDYENEAGEIAEYTTMPAYNLVAIASLSDIIYTVTFYNIWGDEIAVEKDYGTSLEEADIPDLADGEDVNVKLSVDGKELVLPYALTEDITVDSYFYVNVVFYSVYDEENPDNNVVHKTYEFDFEYETTEDDFADLGTPVKTGYHLHEDIPWTWEYIGIMSNNTYFVAYWVPNNYTATFSAVNGDLAGAFEGGVTEITKTVAYDSTFTFDAEAPVLEGYTFKGWTDVEGGTTALDELVMDAEGKTFYPVFVENGTAEFAIELYLMNTEGKYEATPDKTLPESGVVGVTVNTSHDDCQQYVDDWFSADTSEEAGNVYTGIIAEDGSTVLKLYYKRATYKVSVDGAEATDVYHGATIELPETSATTEEGYTLANWTDGTKSYDKGAEVEVTGALNITANNVANSNTKYSVEIYLMDTEGNYGAASDVKEEAGTTDTKATAAHADYAQDAWFSADDAAANVFEANIDGDGNAVLKLYYKRAQYEVVIDGAAAVPVYHGAKVTAPSTSANTPAGSTLVSWNNGAYALGEEIEVTAALTLTPDFKANDDTAYTVEIFLMDEEGNYPETASKVEDETGKTGEEITIAHADYAQADYYYADNAQANVFTGTIAGDGSLVLTLYFKRATYDIVVDGEVVAEDVIHGAEVTLPDTSDNIDEGNELAGWTDGKNTYEPGETIVVEGALDLTPVQKPSDATEYTISIYVMDVNGDYVGTSTTAYGTTGAVQTIVPEYDREGFTVNTEKSNLSAAIAADGSMVLSVYYDRNLYTATFDGVEYPVYYGASLPEVEPAAQEGKEFEAWTPEVPAAMPAEDLEFTSTWTEVMYKIIYVINGTEEEYEYAYGATVTPRENPTVPGMTFIKWNKIIPTVMPAEDVIIVAEFEAAVFKATFVDFDGNVFDEKAVKYGDSIILPTTNPTKEYHVFKGWLNVPDEMPAADITIYPDFERVPVKLIGVKGSTTEIDGGTMIITGLAELLNEQTVDEYLTVEGDGYYVVTPAEGYEQYGYYGTGSKVELYDNADTSAPIETYYIVIYGDVNGDAAVNSLDGSLVEDEAMYVTSWSRGNDKNALKMMAADLNKDGKIQANDADSIVSVALGVTAIDQATGNIIR